MKRVISNQELKEKMIIAIDILCNTVKTTLGPKGSNVIIDNSSFSPFITNDGVTIAENIESEDEIINAILEIAKESSIKTNENVGDGTTTTLVLLQSIFKEGQKIIEAGMNPIALKKELNNLLPDLIKFINNKSYLPQDSDLYKIAEISSNSKEIGQIITEAFLKVKTTSAISIKENDIQETKTILKTGYSIETLIASSYFFKDKSEILLKKTNILLLNNYLNDIEEIAPILNEIIPNNKNLLILAEDYHDNVINQITSLYLNENINIILLKIPEYGKNKIDTLNDLALISNSKIIDDLTYINTNNLGTISSISITKELTTFQIIPTKKTEEKVAELKELLNNSQDIDKAFIEKRLSMLTTGIIEISVGAPTQTERRELKMRFDDALCAIKAACTGIIPGSGIVLYELSENLTNIDNIKNIFVISLKEPLKQIIYNAGLDEKEIINQIKENNYQEIYNINKEMFEQIKTTQVIDPTSVVINSLKNAVSIASMLLTTNSLIINEYQNNLNKINNYNEI